MSDEIENVSKIRISTTIPPEEAAAIEEQVDERIKEFDRWFVSKGNTPIIKSEYAIIKTFLYYALLADRVRTDE